ncbi:MAG: NADH:ubiquinone oxidoreductase [Firmicutes bacterium]|nr:NADH:ubiquinone oxidoreductase [Bacillota bacterium]
MKAKPRIGIYGLTSCAGDQLVLVNCEDELLTILEAVDLRSFVMAHSDNPEGELDVAFVEGAVTQESDLETLKDVRSRAQILIAIGTCAVWGGIPYLSGMGTPLSDHVQVDYAIPGCPIEKTQLLKAIASLLRGDLPLSLPHPVCLECTIRENNCLLQAGEICCGPLTAGGCNARCPSLNRACFGCRGASHDPNYVSARQILEKHGFSVNEVRQRLALFSGKAYEKEGTQVG